MAYIPPLNGGRLNASLSGNSTSAGAGYSLLSTGTLYLAGGNNITLSQNGASVTISGANAPSGSINFSASNTSANLASVTFSNSNGVSFGLNAGVVTASHNGITSQTNQTIGVYATGANTTGQSSSNTMDARSFVVSGQGMYAGMSGSTLQLSVATTYAASNHSHGNPTLNLTNLSGTTASASNGLTLSLSAGAQSSPNISLYALGNTTQNSSTQLNASNLSFNGLGAATMGYSNGSIQVSVPTQTVENQSIGIGGTAGGSSATAGSVSVTGAQLHYNLYAGSNITLSQSANGASGSLSIYGGAGGGGGTLSMYGLGNTTQNSSTSLDARSVSLNGLGAMTVGYSNGSVQLSAPAVSQLTYTGAVSMSSNGSTISIGAPVQTNQTLGLYAVSNTTQSTSGTMDARTLSFQGAGAASVGISNGSIVISAPNAGAGNVAFSGG
ncbi:MAG TPA: hypothetical protein VLF59_03725, partial [Candidatus Saccharimonadales bacterium]|nr:hypothetical protein [Candidatus Saccharimonadales bacterium]